MDITHSEVRRILEILDKAEHVEEFELSLGDVHIHLRRGDAEGPMTSAFPAAQPAPPRQPPSPETPPPRDDVGGDLVSDVGDDEAPAPSLPQAVMTEVPEGMVGIRAPVLGTFYRAPSPSEAPFVELGQKVKSGDALCLIEVMKLFTSVNCEVDGTIAEILVENSNFVEFDQILFLVEPN